MSTVSARKIRRVAVLANPKRKRPKFKVACQSWFTKRHTKCREAYW